MLVLEGPCWFWRGLEGPAGPGGALLVLEWPCWFWRGHAGPGGACCIQAEMSLTL